MSSTSLRDNGRGLGAAADETGDTRRVAHDVPGVVVEVHPHQQVAGEDLLLHDDLAPFLNSMTSSIGMTTSKIRSSTAIERTRLARFDFTLFS